MENNFMTFDEIQKYCNEVQKFKVACKCGHKVMIPYNKGSKVCGWCGHKVYKNGFEKFKERLLKEMRKNYEYNSN